MKKIIIISLTLHLLGKLAVAQQDAQFSQYMFNGIYINPAYAGYREQLNLHAFYRDQWTGIPGAPRTMSVAVDAIANEGNVGLALQVSGDKLGAQKNASVYGNYAYRIRLNEDGSSRLAIGIGVGAVQSGVDGAMLHPNDPEINLPAGIHTVMTPDARAGLFFANSRYYAGFSVDNLVSSVLFDKSSLLIKPKPHYYLTAGVLVSLGENILLKPSFLLKDDMAGPTSLDLNAFFILADMVWIGGAYRTGVQLYNKDYLMNGMTKLNAAVAAVQVFPTPDVRIGYAYDIATGPLQGYSRGTHEISIGYFFKKKYTRMLSPRYF